MTTAAVGYEPVYAWVKQVLGERIEPWGERSPGLSYVSWWPNG